MPKYTGQITNKGLYCKQSKLFAAWRKKNIGLFWRADFSIIGPCRDAKTAQQLGYYWAVLVPAICDELVRLGHTITIEVNGLQAEIPFTKESTHELLTSLCSRVGDDGDVLRISDPSMSITRMIQRIDNVLNFAVCTLGMQEEHLTARKPPK